jgi:hypothetical protein
MRKVMLLAAMLAMALAAAAPAFGQGFVNQEADQFGVVDDSVCSQVFNIAVQQYNAGDQVAVADADAFADASAGPFGTAVAAAVANANAANIANAAGIDVDTVNVCLNNFATVTPTAKKTVTPKATAHAKKKVVWIKGKKFWVVDGKTVTATASATASATAKVAAQVQYGGGGAGGGGGGGTTLPETGGASLLALGAGALLVGGGLVARRLIR